MLERTVRIGGSLYVTHEIRMVTHDIAGDVTVAHVVSTDARGAEQESAVSLPLSMTSTLDTLYEAIADLPMYAEAPSVGVELERAAQAVADAQAQAAADVAAAQGQAALAEQQAEQAYAITALVADMLTDEQAEAVPQAYQPWGAGVGYPLGRRVTYDGQLWRCVQAHTSQVGWEPDATPALWTRNGASEDPSVVEEWVQPTGAQDAYDEGDHVMHGGTEWVSLVDANVWEPGVYGWEEVA